MSVYNEATIDDSVPPAAERVSKKLRLEELTTHTLKDKEVKGSVTGAAAGRKHTA